MPLHAVVAFSFWALGFKLQGLRACTSCIEDTSASDASVARKLCNFGFGLGLWVFVYPLGNVQRRQGFEVSGYFEGLGMV